MPFPQLLGQKHLACARIKAEREAQGMTVELLAERTGLDREEIVEIEAGVWPPSPHQLLALRKALGVTIMWFFEDS